MALSLELVGPDHGARFIEAAVRSATLHEPWVSPPRTREDFDKFLARFGDGRNVSYVAVNENAELVASISMNEIVKGAFQSAYLGFCVFVPFEGRGLMKQAVSLVLCEVFTTNGLHRVEANIQPANERSKGLVRSLRFHLEGFSPRYLKIGGQWRDHERYALTIEEWRAEAGANCERNMAPAGGRFGSPRQANSGRRR